MLKAIKYLKENQDIAVLAISHELKYDPIAEVIISMVFVLVSTFIFILAKMAGLNPYPWVIGYALVVIWFAVECLFECAVCDIEADKNMHAILKSYGDYTDMEFSDFYRLLNKARKEKDKS